MNNVQHAGIEVQTRVRIAAMGAEIGAALADGGGLDEALRHVAEAVVRHFGAAFARIWTLNEVDQVLELRASAGLYTNLDGGHSRVPLGELKIGRIAADDKPYMSNDVQHDRNVDREWAARARMIAFAGYPLVVDQHVVGVVALFAQRALEAQTLHELSTVAEMIAQYIARKYAQEKLERSERRFRAMIEHAHGIVSILSADGTIMYESPYVKDVLGYSYGERVGSNGFELIHPDERDDAFRTFSNIVAVPDAAVTAEFRFLHADGSWRWLEVTGHNLVEDPAVGGVVVYTRDISERKQSEQELQRNEARFRALIEHAHDVVTILAADGTILYESRSIERVLGLTPDVVIGTNAFDMIHLDDRDSIKRTFAELVSRPDGTITAQCRFHHADGSWRWLEVLGYNQLHDLAVGGVVVHSTDITERVLSSLALQQSEERFRALIERSSDMITLHQANGTISYASSSTLRVLGHDPAQLVDRNMLQEVHPDDRWSVTQAFTGLVSEPGRSTTARYRMRHRDGSWRWIETTGTNLLHLPSVQAVVCNRRDVTAEVEAQQLLETRVDERTLELTTLLQLAHEVGSTLELGRLLRMILDLLNNVVPYSGAALLVLENDELVARAQRGQMPHPDFAGLKYRICDWGDAWATLCAGEPIRIADVRGDDSMARIFQHLVAGMLETSFGFIRACMWVPLIARGRTIGVFSVAHGQPGYHTEQHARLALAFAQQAATAMENARLFEAARGAATLEERQRLARELHDSVSQALYAIALNGAAATESLRRREQPRAARQIRQVRQLARAGLAEMRALIFELRAESLAEEGLVGALTKLSAAIEARHELKVRRSFGQEPAAPLATKEALYRIAQEALHNVVKHARARQADLALDVNNDKATLTIRDNGTGFEVGFFPGHLGLRSMRERAEAVGGKLLVGSELRVGTTIRAEVPLPSGRGSTDVPAGGEQAFDSLSLAHRQQSIVSQRLATG